MPAPERTLTPTVAVICVVALASCGTIRLMISPLASRAAAALMVITVRRMAGKPPTEFSGKSLQSQNVTTVSKLFRTLMASHLSQQDPRSGFAAAAVSEAHTA